MVAEVLRPPRRRRSAATAIVKSTVNGTRGVGNVWVFGYGSLIWRPGIAYQERRVARVRGWTRRFWQGSHDHRGLPHAPGRVVTLVPEAGATCEGVAYRVGEAVAKATFEGLDHREKNGYRRHSVKLEFRLGGTSAGIVYIAPVDNHAFLGPAPVDEMIAQISSAAGPSGTNLDYLRQLEAALRRLEIDDPHVFELAHRLRESRPQAAAG